MESQTNSDGLHGNTAMHDTCHAITSPENIHSALKLGPQEGKTAHLSREWLTESPAGLNGAQPLLTLHSLLLAESKAKLVNGETKRKLRLAKCWAKATIAISYLFLFF